MDAYQRHSHQVNTIEPAPSNISAATMSRVTREELANFLLAAPTDESKAPGPSPLANIKLSDLAIVDVRDSDYIGGHIRSCIHVPSGNLEWKLPELVRQLWTKKVVVFHCALSQQRGPSAAAKYARERERQQRQKYMMEDATTDLTVKIGGGAFVESNGPASQEQKVLILTGGFVEWQEKYGMNEALTEGYVPDIWEDTFY
jgi:rhodanese-related sulfurtransferase